jgi:glutathione peroxidase
MPLLHTFLLLLQHTVSVYTFTLPALNGGQINLSQYQGKKILLVNTASQCHYASQYAELQQLQQLYANSLVVIAIPSNNFNNMEPGSNDDIAQFVQQYNISFPIAQKTDVLGENAHPLYQWLANRHTAGGADALPRWNFTKILIGRTGEVEKVFDPAISPLAQRVKDAVEQ